MTSTPHHVRRAHYALVAQGTAVMTLEMMSLSGGEDIGTTKISSPDTPPSSSSAFLVIDNIPTIVVLADVLRFIEPFLDHILHVKCILPLPISKKDEPAVVSSAATVSSSVSPSYYSPRPLTYSLLCEIRDFVGDATTGMMYGDGEDEDGGGETLLTFSLERYLETFAEECDGYPLTALMPDVLLALYRVVSSDAVVTLEADEAVANSPYFTDGGENSSSSPTNVAESEGTSAAASPSSRVVVLRVPLSELVAAPPAEEEETTATAAQGSSVVGEVQINAHAPTGDDDFGDENGEGTGAEEEEEIDRSVRRDGMMVSSHTSTLFDASTPPLFSEMSSANNTRSNTADMMIGSTQFANEEEERVEGATFSFSATASGGGEGGPRHKATRQSAGIAKDDTMAMGCASSASSSIASSPSPSASRRTPAATPSSFPTTFGYGHRSGPSIRASSTSPFSHPLQISATTAGGGVGVGVGGFPSQLQASSSSTSPSLSGLPRSVLNRSPMFVLPPAAAAIHVSKVKCVSSARQQQQQASSAAGGDTVTPQGLLGGEEVHIVSDTASLAVDISSDRRGGIFDRSPANSNCPICLETMGTLPCLTTLCGHQFHTHCYTKVGPKCPLCRFEIAALDERYFQLMTYSLPLGHGGQRNDPPTMTGGNGIGHTRHRLAFAPEEEDASEGQAARALRRSEARRDYSQRFPPETTRLDAGAKDSQTCQSSAPDSNKYSCASASQVPLLGSSSSPPSLSGALKSSIPSRQTIREIFARLSRSTPARQTNASGGREASAGLADPPVGQRHDTTSLWELAHTRRRGSLSGQHHRRPSYSHGSHEGSMNNNDNDFPSLSLKPQSATGDPQCALCARSSNGLDAAAAHRTKRNNIPIHEDDDDESPITQPPQAVSTNSTGPEEPSTRKGGEGKGGGKTSAPLPTSGPSHPTTRTFWMCLVCGATHGGVTSCGHAYLHYVETGHRFAVDVHAPRVWDYHEGTYVHRLVQQLRMAATSHSLPSAPSAPSLDTVGGSSSKHGSDSASDRPIKEAAPLPPSSSDRNNNHNDVNDNDNTTQQSHEDTHGRTTPNKRKKEKEVSYPPQSASSRSISPALAKRNLAEVNGSWSAADTVWVDYGFNDEEQRAQLISSVDFLAEFYSRLLEDQLRAQEEYYQKELASVALGIAVGDLIGEEEARRCTIALEEANDEQLVKGLKEITALLREAASKNKAKAREIVKGSTSGKASTNPSASAAAHQAGKEKSVGGAGSDDAGLEVNEITLAAAEKNLEAVRKLRAAMDAKGASHAKSLKEKDETISKLRAQLESLYAQL